MHSKQQQINKEKIMTKQKLLKNGQPKKTAGSKRRLTKLEKLERDFPPEAIAELEQLLDKLDEAIKQAMKKQRKKQCK